MRILARVGLILAVLVLGATLLAMGAMVIFVHSFDPEGPNGEDEERFAVVSADPLLHDLPEGATVLSEEGSPAQISGKSFDKPSGYRHPSKIEQVVRVGDSPRQVLDDYVAALGRTGWSLTSVICTEEGGFRVRGHKVSGDFGMFVQVAIPAMTPEEPVDVFLYAPHHDEPPGLSDYPEAGFGCAQFLGLETQAIPDAFSTIYHGQPGKHLVPPGGTVIKDDIIITNINSTTRTVTMWTDPGTWPGATVVPDTAVLEPGEWIRVELTVDAPDFSGARQTIRLFFDGLTQQPREIQFGYETA